MAHLTYSCEEIAKRGQDLYETLRSQVELTPNIGKIIAIDVVTGEYEIDDDILVVSDRLKARLQNAEMWAERIGFNAVYSVGGILSRTTL